MDFNKIAQKWQKKWDKDKLFQVEADKRKKYYIAIVYPYMSGLLHLGHLFTYTTPEVLLRYKRMNNFNVLAKFAFHCTGTPIVAAAQKVKEKEPNQLATLKKMGISDKDILKFSNPEYWCEYFPKETIKDVKNMGFSIDERYTFKTTYLEPAYDKFIQWQFNKLKDLGYIKKGRHPVVWCPKDNLPVGDHDRSEGEGETPQEFMLFKHKLKNKFIITATLRHDTVLGITNLFVHPDIEYCEAQVDNETWILSKKSANALNKQGHKVQITGRIKGRDLIGKKTQEFDGSEVLILPATFVDENFGTGLVHSVPSDSPDDLIALRDLQKDEALCQKYNINLQEIKNIKPIAVLNTPEYGDIAAQAMIDKYKVKSQTERDKLEKIKKELYKISHYTATFNNLYKNKFSKNLEGKKVEEGKDIIKEDLIKANFATPYYELTGKVVCRCLTECNIKMVENQWFLQYNDTKWKDLAHKCLDNMTLYPEQVRKQFNYVLDWLHRWACTREFGLGTKLPWDEKWVIESLSDSTIQMAYNTISKYLQNPKEYNIKVENLNDALFDYIFLGKGKPEEIESSTKIPNKLITQMHSDFNYWYPFDFRNSAKDLLQNHLAFCIFNHTALFPQKHWPKSFCINGRIMVDNEKMSKSKGNFFTMRELYTKHGPDIVRLTAINAGEGMDDANFDMTFLETSNKKLTELHEFIKDNYNKGRTNKLTIDKWFESSIHKAISKTTKAFENILFKSAVQYGFLDLHRDLKWYLHRTNGSPNKQLINLFIETQLLLLAPITPHFCEECWTLIGKKPYISTASWPKADKKAMIPKMDSAEELINNTLRDIREVLKLAKVDQPSKIQLFISSSWKYDLFTKVHSLLQKTQNPGEILKTVMQDAKLRQHGKQISKFLPKMVSQRKIPIVDLSQKEELTSLNEAQDFIKQEFNCIVDIISADNSEEQKAFQATPGKVAILVQ
jgi:leucyl-tRNA synthetase